MGVGPFPPTENALYSIAFGTDKAQRGGKVCYIYDCVVVDDVGAGAVGVVQLLAGRDRSSSQLHSRRLFIGQQRYTTSTNTSTTSNHQRLDDDAHYTNNNNIQPVTFVQLNSI